MNVKDYLRIAPFVNDCPNCGHGNVGTNDATGEWHGSLEVDDKFFIRKCRCGFEVMVDANLGTTKAEIKKQINIALEKFKMSGGE